VAFEYETFRVSGGTFKVMKMGGATATKMWPRLVRILAGALEKMPRGVGGDLVEALTSEDKEMAVTALLAEAGGIAGVFEELCKRLPEEEVQLWMERLFEGGPGDRKPALYNGAPIIDAMDLGDVDSDAIWECIQCALKANYAAFRKGLAGLLAAGLTKTDKATEKAPETTSATSETSTT
jgi:hypothetical protein